MSVEVLRRNLRRYRAEVPEGWSGAARLNGGVLWHAGSPREILWTVWGEEPAVVAACSEAGARVRGSAPLTLEDATIALLGRKEVA